jgi:acyl-CoA thioesterase II
MDAREWLGLQPTHNPMRWTLPVTPGISTSGPFLFGGCGLGAAIAAMEHVSGLPVIWATAQYLSYARPPSVLDIDVTVAAQGKHTTQARSVGHVADTEILTVNAALGTRGLDADGIWVTAPEVPSPEECPVRPPRIAGTESIMDRLDIRLANARPWQEIDGHPMPDGRSALWARMPDLLDLSSGAGLAILGDYVPFGISQAIGRIGGGNSLDNTLRVVTRHPTEWILADVRVHAVADGFGHGLVHLWAEDGTLLGTASQSAIVRKHRDWEEDDAAGESGGDGAPPRPEGDRA